MRVSAHNEIHIATHAASELHDFSRAAVVALPWVAEVAAHLDVPVAVVKILLGDLISRGHVLARAPYTTDNPVSQDLLQAVLDGIKRL
jgi:hypothetical protein